MRDWPATFEAALKVVPVIVLLGTLARLVPLSDLLKKSPPDFLFASGKPNRYNPAGIECVYFSEDGATAQLEYKRQWAKVPGIGPPAGIFSPIVRLRRVLDLSCGNTLQILKLTPHDLHKPWRGAGKPTVTQLLGEAVAERSNISAIRYPSDAAKKAGRTGCNVVIYRTNVRRPDSVIILDEHKRTLDKWP